MVEAGARRLAPARLASAVCAGAALAATAAVLAGCGGDSARDQVGAVARAYDRAFVAANGRTICALVTSSLRREFGGSGLLGAPTSCADSISFAAATGQDDYAPRPIITAVHISGSRASATVRSTAGVATLPFSREAGRWRVAGPAHFLSRNWLVADYRVRHSGGLPASAVASILDRRAKTIIGAYAQAQAIGRDEVRVAVAEPGRLADLAAVTRRDEGRLAFYDWEADALTPSGMPVSAALRRRDGAAMLISQGSGTEPPGTAGGLPLRAALKLAAAQRPVAHIVAGANAAAPYFVLRDRAALSRSDITDAYPSSDAGGRPAIGIEFTPHGARAFQRLTTAIARRGAMLSSPQLALNQHMAAVLDGKLLAVIYVNYHVYPRQIPSLEAIDIEGGFTLIGAYRLARKIAAPPLSADLQLIHTSTITRRD